MAEWGGIKIQTRSGNYYNGPSPSVGPTRMRPHMNGALNQTLSQHCICTVNISPSTGVWYTWKWSCSVNAVGVDVLVEFPTHCWLSDCWLRLKREDVHVQKQWGFLNTASGSSYKPQAQMYSMFFYVSSCLFSSPEIYIPPAAAKSAQFHRKSRSHLIFTIFFTFFSPPVTTVENEQYQRTDTAVKILEGYHTYMHTHTHCEN